MSHDLHALIAIAHLDDVDMYYGGIQRWPVPPDMVETMRAAWPAD